ncbi:MAG: DUF4139 domain-containing protein [Chitinivibrionia bacterium]|nr:DUF4139 domain-containing protein [Chitinivibrionia bacterium]
MLAAAACLCLPAQAPASGNELKSTLKDQKSVSVTVYNSNLGVVKDVRSLTLPKGVVSLTFEGVASLIDPTSVHIRSLDRPLDLDVLEQNFEYDLISPEKLMEKYLGREIELVTKDDSGEHTKTARLLGIERGYVYESDGKIAGNPPGRVVMPALPEGLISQPSLIWLLDAGSREHTVEASYLTAGMTWRANYVAVLSEDDRALDLSGWVTIDNRSGAAYNNASLKLIAGDVNRIEQPVQYAKATAVMAEDMLGRGGFEEKAFFEYHMYNLQRTTTLKDNQTKQIRLMDAAGIAVEKRFVYSSQHPYFFYMMGDVDKDTKVGVFLSLENAKKNNLGMPLPKGVVRVFKKDDDGALEFLGEDQIDHTPEDETIRIKLGNAFDIVAERVQTDFKQYRNTFESAYKITVRNHKDERVVVSVVEHLAGDWKIMENTHEYVKESAFKVRFDVPVEKKGEAELVYRISIKR